MFFYSVAPTVRKGIKDPKVDKIQKKDPEEDERKKKEIKSHGGHPKSKKYKKKVKKKEKRKKERGGSTTILYSTLVLQSSTCTSVCKEFSCCTCITKWGSLHYRTWLAYSKDEPPQKSSRSS